MKLFEKRDVTWCEKLPEAWFSMGRLLSSNSDRYFTIRLPVMVYQTLPSMEQFLNRTGWYWPKVMIRQMKGKWHLHIAYVFYSAGLDEEWTDYEGFGSGQDMVVNR